MTQEKYIPKKNWEEEYKEKFHKLDWETEIVPIIRACGRFALQDTDQTDRFTPLVIKNIKIITNKDPMEVTFQQWKSFMAYYNYNCRPDVVKNNFSKLGI